MPYILACHLQLDADPDPDPASHLDADPDPAYRINADPDPNFQFDASTTLRHPFMIFLWSIVARAYLLGGVR